MLNIRHILRLHSQGQTMSEIIVQTGILRKTLNKIINDFKASNLSFADMPNWTSDKFVLVGEYYLQLVTA